MHKSDWASANEVLPLSRLRNSILRSLTKTGIDEGLARSSLTLKLRCAGGACETLTDPKFD